MSGRRSLTAEVMHDERMAYEAMLKAITIKTKVAAQELAWAQAENNANFFTLFGKLAEIRYIQDEAERKMAEKYLEVNKSFKNIFQEEKAVEETRKEQQNYLVRVTKIEKQLELARSSGDEANIEVLENDMTAQGNLYNQLTLSVEAKERKLDIYKANLLKKGLRQQAEGALALAQCYQQVFKAQRDLVDLLPSDLHPAGEPTDELKERMAAVVDGVAEVLSVAPPLGGLEPWNANQRNKGEYSKLSSNRRSLVFDVESSGHRAKREADDMSYDRKRFSSCSSDGRLDSFGHSSSSWDSINDAPPLPPPRCDSYSSQSQSPLSTHFSKSSPPATPPPLSLKPHQQQQQQQPPPQQLQNQEMPNVYCEVVIPSARTKGRPELVKSRSESSVSKLSVQDSYLHKKKQEEMTSRLDQRLEKAGLLKPSKPLFNVDTSSHVYSTCSRPENVPPSPHDPGYARLVVSPVYPTCPINGPERTECSPEQEYGEEDYANPLDALKMNKKSAVSGSSTKPAPPTKPVPPTKPAPRPSPPGSPQPPNSGSRASPDVSSQTSPKLPSRPDPYQSVEDVRMMREMQLQKGKEKVVVKLRENDARRRNVGGVGGNTTEARVSRDLDHLDEETEGYSRPFDALAAHRRRVHTTSEATTSTVSLNTTGLSGPIGQGQRSNSAEKLHGKEPSARFLHQVSSPGDSSSTSSSQVVLTQDSDPEGKRRRAKSFSKNQVAGKGLKHDGQTGVVEDTDASVKQYILKVEDKQGEKDVTTTRGATGRTSSINSSLKPQTPVKITKLRNGKDRVAIVGGKKK